MLVKCVREFRDLENKRMLRSAGERFEVTPERFAALNATRYGTLVEQADNTSDAKSGEKKVKGRPNKAELLKQAEALGIDVPEGATNPQIAKLVEEAK